MRNLLAAGFMRVFRSSSYWCMAITMPLINVYMALVNSSAIKDVYGKCTPEYLLFNHTMFFEVAIAIFLGLLVGCEYSDGTIRNKLVCGHTRTRVYLVYYITFLTGVILVHILSVAAAYLFCGAIFGKLTVSVSVLIRDVIYSMISLVAITALILMIVIVAGNKAIGCAVANVVATVLMLVKSYYGGMLTSGNTKYDRVMEFVPSAYIEKIILSERLINANIIVKVPMPFGCIITGILLLAVGTVVFRNKNIR